MIFTIFFIILASDQNNTIIPSEIFSRENNNNNNQSTTKQFYYYKGIIIDKNGITKFLSTLVMKKIIPKIIIQSSTKIYSATHYHYQAKNTKNRNNFTIQKLHKITQKKKLSQLEIHNPKNDIDYLHDIQMNPNLYNSNYLQQVYNSSTLFLI